MIATILDHGAGNLHSLAKAVAAAAGVEVRIERDTQRVRATDVLILPGVGAFPSASAAIAPVREELRDALLGGLPCVGICLGMQLLFERSAEGGGAGLGLFPGTVTRLDAERVPHIGWNSIEDGTEPLLARTPLPRAYFANAYACRPETDTDVTAWTRHEADRFPAMVRRARTIGVQFHPEKSSRQGVAFLHACIREVTQ